MYITSFSNTLYDSNFKTIDKLTLKALVIAKATKRIFSNRVTSFKDRIILIDRI